MLLLSYSSDYFRERTWYAFSPNDINNITLISPPMRRHCVFGEAWSLPCLAALLALPDGGREWGRFTLITLIAGCEYLLYDGGALRARAETNFSQTPTSTQS